MKNIKLTCEYDGTNFYGWQRQSTLPTVQGELEKAIVQLTGENVTVNGCSRTDRGVHAFNHVSNFLSDSNIPPENFYLALNTKLPDGIVCKASEEAEQDFHARFSCRGKKYSYLFFNNPTRSALLNSRTYHIKDKLDVGAMEEAAKHFVGTYDFSAFQAMGSESSSTIKTIFDTSIKITDKIICFEIAGDGFLYNMVRIMAGTLAYVGLGKIQAHEIPRIIALHDRKNAGITAPAQGLYLKEVYYKVCKVK